MITGKDLRLARRHSLMLAVRLAEYPPLDDDDREDAESRIALLAARLAEITGGQKLVETKG